MGSEKPVGTIKKERADFQVRESGLPLRFETAIYGATSPYTRFALTKRGMENDPALREVARQLGVRNDAISSCGRKDSFAETVQEIVVAGNFHPSFSHDRIWLWQLGPAKGRLGYGRHNGNTFAIKVYTDHAERIVGGQFNPQFKNYFGYQRFVGSNIEVGRLLLEGKYADAYDAIQGTREQKFLDRFIAKMRLGYHVSKTDVMGYDHDDMRQLCKGAIQRWQSHLWNLLAKKTRPSFTAECLPFWTNEKETSDLYNEWWNPKALASNMLPLAYPLPRPLLTEARNLRAERLPDGWRYHFTLRSGAFATTFLGNLYELKDDSLESYNARREAQQAST